MKSYHAFFVLLVVLLLCVGILAKLTLDQISKEPKGPKGPIKTQEEIENNPLLRYHGTKILYSGGMKYVIYLPFDPRWTTLIVNLTKDSLECEYYRKHIKP